jgi:hypothetical protein
VWTAVVPEAAAAIRPIATSIVPICYVRFTSTPTVPFAQVAALAEECGFSA